MQRKFVPRTKGHRNRRIIILSHSNYILHYVIIVLRDIPVVSRCSFPAAQIAVGNAVTQQTVGLTALPPNVLISPCFPWTRRQTARVNLLTPRAASQRNRPVPRKREKNMHRLSPEICIKER